MASVTVPMPSKYIVDYCGSCGSFCLNILSATGTLRHAFGYYNGKQLSISTCFTSVKVMLLFLVKSMFHTAIYMSARARTRCLAVGMYGWKSYLVSFFYNVAYVGSTL